MMNCISLWNFIIRHYLLGTVLILLLLPSSSVIIYFRNRCPQLHVCIIILLDVTTSSSVPTSTSIATSLRIAVRWNNTTHQPMIQVATTSVRCAACIILSTKPAMITLLFLILSILIITVLRVIPDLTITPIRWQLKQIQFWW